MPRGSLFADARRFLCLCVVTVCPFTNSRMLPRPPLVPPEVECPANVAALYGPGIVLFGTAVVNALNCHAEGIEGIVTPKLSDTVAACGGASKWQGFVADCVAKLSKLPGSIAFNWISIDCTADGPSGACCLTCGGNSISFGGGRATSSPFNSYLQHTQSRKHEKARDALLAKVEAAAVASGLPRAEIAGTTPGCSVGADEAVKEAGVEAHAGRGGCSRSRKACASGVPSRRLGHACAEREGESAADGACAFIACMDHSIHVIACFRLVVLVCGLRSVSEHFSVNWHF